MTYVEPLSLQHSWPLWEQPRHFELGHILNSALIDMLEPARAGDLGLHHAGCWECDLSDNSLNWSGGVFDIFGLARDAKISREDCLRFYSEESRAKMEALRSYAIRHRRGFTIDIEIRAAVGEDRWVRLMGAPVLVRGRPARLHGLKLIV